MKNGNSTSAVVSVVAVPDKVSCTIGEETVILSLKDGVYYGLNEVATHVWSFIQTPRSATEIRDLLLERYDVSPEDCMRDVLELIERLAQWKLVVLKNGQLPN